MHYPKQKRRSLVALGLAASLSGGAITALGVPPADAATTQNITVQVISGVAVSAFQEIVKGFEATHPNITVTIESVSDTDLRGPNIPVLSSTHPPDVGWLQRGLGIYSVLLAHHDLLSLSSVYKADNLAQAYGPALTQYYTNNGQQYGILTDRATYDIVFYNENEFKKAGITAPANHELSSINQLVSIAAKLTKAGYQPLTLAGNSSYMESWLLDTMIPTGLSTSQFQNLLTNFSPSVKPTITYNSPQFVNILKAVDDLYTEKALTANVLSTTDTAEPAEFAAGQAAMALSGVWGPGEFATDGAKFPVGWMALPPVIPGHDAPIAYWAGDTIVVPAHAQYPQAAKEFVAYAGETSVEESILPKYSLIPGVGNYNPAALKPLGPVDLSVLQAAKTIGSVPSWDLIVPPALGQAWENQQIQSMWSGQITPQALAQKFQAQWLKLRKIPASQEPS